MKSLRDLQQEITAWADAQFPNRTAHDALVKLILHEIPEFCRNPRDPLEYADLEILLVDVASLNGIDIESAVEDKMAINRKRSWRRDPVTRLYQHEPVQDR